MHRLHVLSRSFDVDLDDGDDFEKTTQKKTRQLKKGCQQVQRHQLCDGGRPVVCRQQLQSTMLARSTPMMFGCNKAAAGARLIENVRVLHDSSVTSSSSGRTTGSIGANAAESVGALMKGAASAAVVAGGRIEPRWALSPDVVLSLPHTCF